MYSDQAKLVIEMLDLQERVTEPLVDAFSSHDRPEHGIDIVRSTWNDRMAATRVRVRELGAAAPPNPVRTVATVITKSPIAVGGGA